MRNSMALLFLLSVKVFIVRLFHTSMQATKFRTYTFIFRGSLNKGKPAPCNSNACSEHGRELATSSRSSAARRFCRL